MSYKSQNKTINSAILSNDSILTNMESLDKIVIEEVMAIMPFPVEKQFISSQELHEAGYSNYKIRQMVSAGDLIGVNRKWYENAHYSGEINDFYAVSAHAGFIKTNGITTNLSVQANFPISSFYVMIQLP